MNLLRLIERNLQLRRLSSALTSLSVALGVMLVAAILVLRAELSSTYLSQGEGYSLIVGPAGGSPLSLVLNAVYHVEKSSGLIPYSVLGELESGANRRLVRLALPYAMGDSFRGFPVVATTDAVFSRVFPYPRGDTPEEKLRAGRPFRFRGEDLREALDDLGRLGGEDPEHDHAAADEHDHAHDHAHGPEGIWEAVVGAEVADRLGLEVGAQIEPTHGVEGGQEHSDEHLWTVVGILKRSRTAIDRVVFINLDSFYRIADHAGGRIPETGEPALSAIVLFPAPGWAKAPLVTTLNKRPDITVAEVGTEIRKLLDIVGDVDGILLLISVMVVVIGVVSILVAIYNTMNERRRELAIMRAIGAHRSTIFLSIVGEAAALTFAGAVIGLALGHLLIFLCAGYVESASGLRPDPLRVVPEELILLVVVTLVGALAGLIPAWKAYRTDVAGNLTPLS